MILARLSHPAYTAPAELRDDGRWHSADATFAQACNDTLATLPPNHRPQWAANVAAEIAAILGAGVDYAVEPDDRSGTESEQ